MSEVNDETKLPQFDEAKLSNQVNGEELRERGGTIVSILTGLKVYQIVFNNS